MRTKILILTVLIAILFRFVDLGKNPPSLNWDEVAIGWNAYSVLQTGKDEFGISLPLIFRSFDDYKSPAYIYATAASIFVFGKNEYAIRFSSALFGVLTVALFYFFVKRILITKNTDTIWSNRIGNIALFATCMLAISPWHIHFSRVAFEANMALFFEIVGTLLFLRWIDKGKLRTLLISITAFTIASYAYTSARVLVVLILIGITAYYYKEILSLKKQLIVGVIFGLILCMPLILQMYQGVGLARYNATTILGREKMEIFERNKAQAKEDYDFGNGWLSSKVHNFRIPIVQNVVNNYLSHYNYGFLFYIADLPRHQVPGFGLLYLWQMPLMIAGAVFLIKNRKYLNAQLSLWWLFLAPIPAAITWQVPHSIRALLLLPIFSILSGIGLWVFLKYIQKQDLKAYTRPTAVSRPKKVVAFSQWLLPKTYFLLILICIFTSAIQLAIAYSTYLPAEFSANWLYGRKEMVASVEDKKEKFDHVIVSLSLDWSYLWFLWYGGYSPQWYLDKGGTVSGGFMETQNTVGKIEFHNFEFEKQKLIPNSLMVGSPSDFPRGFVPDEKILDLSGKPIIYIVKS
ncbi:MAG: glycosyltransferase family 39 protein [bacterium]|nr:glycosyltransferase family 39 protein [bacterium]